MKITKLTAEQAQQIEEAFENAESVAASINAGKHHVIQIDDEKCFWQREEWVRWAIDEVLPEIREALSAIRAARAQEQAEQEPVGEVVMESMGVGDAQIVRFRMNGRIPPVGTKLYAAHVRTKDLTAQEKANIIYAADHRNPMAMIDAAIALYREKNK